MPVSAVPVEPQPPLVETLLASVRLVRRAAIGVTELPAGDVAPAMAQAQELVRAAQVLVLELTRHADALGTARQVGATSTQAWLAQTSGTSHASAGKDVRLARELDQAAPRTKDALTTGGIDGISVDKARVVVDAMTRLPVDLAAPERDRVERDLVDKARRFGVEELRRAARRALDVIDPVRADAAETAILVAEEAQARRQVSFWMRTSDVDGMVDGGFTLPALEADMLRAVLQAATAPRARTPGGASNADLDLSRPDHRVRAGHAFCDLARHLPTDRFHGGLTATLMVTIDQETLTGALERAGTTSFGTRISPGEVRRIACEAGILPAVFGKLSLPLDLGRAARLFSPAQRIALGYRDKGCAFPGCDRPPGWCEAHHITPWHQGGTTNLADGVLLCAHHHRLIHNTDWEVRLGADGMPEFLPPRSVDPTRAPRRNHRWRPPPQESLSPAQGMGG